MDMARGHHLPLPQSTVTLLPRPPFSPSLSHSPAPPLYPFDVRARCPSSLQLTCSRLISLARSRNAQSIDKDRVITPYTPNERPINAGLSSACPLLPGYCFAVNYQSNSGYNVVIVIPSFITFLIIMRSRTLCLPGAAGINYHKFKCAYLAKRTR